MYFAKWQHSLIYLDNHMRIHRKLGERKPLNTKPTSKSWNLTFFFFPTYIISTAMESSRELKRAMTKEENAIKRTELQAFLSKRSLLFCLQIWCLELVCFFWLDLSAWTVTLNYWGAKSKVWWYSNAIVQSQCIAKVVNHPNWFY